MRFPFRRLHLGTGALLAALSLTGASPLSSQTPGTPGHSTNPPESHPSVRPALSVSARSSVTVAPDRAELGVAVESRARTAAQASAESARIQTSVLEALRRLGLRPQELQTRAIQVSPEYQYPREGGRPTITGYVARNEVIVTLTDLAKVGAVVDAALGQGATQVSGPRFFLADADAARREALDGAVKKAMADAQAMARAAGLRLGSVLEISNLGGVESPEQPRPLAMMRAAADAAPTPVEAGVITVEAVVHLRIALVP